MPHFTCRNVSNPQTSRHQQGGAVGQQQAFLFATGAFVSLVGVLVVGRLMKGQSGAGWVYFGTITFRLLALLAGCTLIYLLASPGAGLLMGAYAAGIAVAWLGHFVVALVLLRE